MKERWKDIPGYKGFYQAFNLGRIKRTAEGNNTYVGKILKLAKDGSGHLMVGLCKNGKRRLFLVHRLVLKAFIGEPPFLEYETRHLDGNPQNNTLGNLKWGTRSENSQDSIKHNTKFTPDNRGSKHGLSKLIESNILEIREMARKGILQKEIAAIFHISQQAISDIVTRRGWRHIND